MDKSFTSPLLDNFYVTKTEYTQFHRCDYSMYPRPFSSIVLLLKGTGQFTSQDISFSVAESDAVLIPSGTKYISDWTGTPDITYLCVHFNFSNRFAEYSPQNYALQKIDLCSDIVRQNLDFLMSHLQKKGLEPLEAMSGFYSFYSQALQSLQPIKVRGHAWEQVVNAVKYIENNPSENPTVKELAQLCALSESHFYELFAKAVGCSPMVYKNKIKVQTAMSMLSNKTISVSEIVTDLGFSSEQYFRETFKHFTGKSPTAYRRSLLM